MAKASSARTLAAFGVLQLFFRIFFIRSPTFISKQSQFRDLFLAADFVTSFFC